MTLKCLVIDDEPIARKGIAGYVAETDFLTLVAQCQNPLKASKYLTAHSVDLLFLDIQMPGLSGISFLKTLSKPPMVIFTTAYPEYAVEGYELDIIDYLVKPISFERFLKAAQKAQELHHLRQPVDRIGNLPDHFFVKADGKFEKIRYTELRYVEGMQNYVVLHTTSGKLIAYMTLASIAEQLPDNLFLKVHKSYIVGITHLRAIEGNEILIGQSRIPISRNLKEEVVNRILGNKLFHR